MSRFGYSFGEHSSFGAHEKDKIRSRHLCLQILRECLELTEFLFVEKAEFQVQATKHLGVFVDTSVKDDLRSTRQTSPHIVPRSHDLFLQLATVPDGVGGERREESLGQCLFDNGKSTPAEDFRQRAFPSSRRTGNPNNHRSPFAAMSNLTERKYAPLPHRFHNTENKLFKSKVRLSV